jgi:hypothetical protein
LEGAALILRYVKSKADWWANFSHYTRLDFGFTMSVDNMMMTADRVYQSRKAPETRQHVSAYGCAYLMYSSKL